jgi:hypothetical protein
MRSTSLAWLAALTLAGFATSAAEACHSCKQTPCVAPQPAYQCVTEQVPYTVMKTRMKVDYVPETCTVMVKQPVTTYVTKTRTIQRPVYDTTYVTRTYTVQRPVYDTTYVTQTYNVCRPVTTTRQVTSYCLQPTSWTETVPTYTKSGCCGLGLLCGKLHGQSCNGLAQTGCTTVTRTCYTQVPVTRDVVETSYVNETASRQVPVRTCRIECEQKTEQVPVRTCRMVCETQTYQCPVTTYTCVPKTVTKMRRVCSKEVVPVTCYRTVKRMVPVVCAAPVAYAPAAYAAPQDLAAPQAAVTPTTQAPPAIPTK